MPDLTAHQRATRLVADFMNAGSRWRREAQASMEYFVNLLDLPTRSEINSLMRRLKAVENRLHDSANSGTTKAAAEKPAAHKAVAHPTVHKATAHKPAAKPAVAKPAAAKRRARRKAMREQR